MIYKTVTAVVLVLTFLASPALAVQPGWLETFSIAQPSNKRPQEIENGVPVSALPKLYSGYGGVRIAQTKDYEKIQVPNGKGGMLTIIRPKGTDYHQ